MNIETQPRDDCQLTIHVTIEAEQFQKAMQRAARAISKRVKIPGFRPGNAPYAMVVQHVGEDAIREEAIDLLAEEIYPSVIKELDLHPPAAGSLTNVEEGDPLRLTFVVPQPPQVTLGDYRSVRVPYEWKPPTDEQVEVFLNALRFKRATFHSVADDCPVQPGNLVTLDIAFRKADSSPDAKPLLEEKPSFVLVLERTYPGEMPFPGFSSQLIGLRVGERKTIRYRYPDDYSGNEAVRGQEIVHEVTIREILAVELPELNDDFAREIGDFETVEALRRHWGTWLQQYSKARYDDAYADRVLEEIRRQATVMYPPQLLEESVTLALEETKQELAEDGLDLETHLQRRQMTFEEFVKNEIEPRARDLLERQLVLDKVIEQENLDVPADEVRQAFGRQLHEWLESKTQSAGKKKMPQPTTQETQDMLRRAFLEAYMEQAFERLRAIGRGEAPQPAAADEAQSVAEPAEAEVPETPASSPSS